MEGCTTYHRLTKSSLLFATIALFATGCVSVEITEDPDRKGGYIIYNPNGAPEAVRQRRNDSIMRIKDYCGSSQHKITREGVRPRRQNEGTSSLQGTLAVLGSDEVMEIVFRCL